MTLASWAVDVNNKYRHYARGIWLMIGGWVPIRHHPVAFRCSFTKVFGGISHTCQQYFSTTHPPYNQYTTSICFSYQKEFRRYLGVHSTYRRTEVTGDIWCLLTVAFKIVRNRFNFGPMLDGHYHYESATPSHVSSYTPRCSTNMLSYTTVARSTFQPAWTGLRRRHVNDDSSTASTFDIPPPFDPSFHHQSLFPACIVTLTSCFPRGCWVHSNYGIYASSSAALMVAEKTKTSWGYVQSHLLAVLLLQLVWALPSLQNSYLKEVKYLAPHYVRRACVNVASRFSSRLCCAVDLFCKHLHIVDKIARETCTNTVVGD